MTDLTRLSRTFQDLLGARAREIAGRHRLIHRHRQFDGSSLLATFVLGCWRSPGARAEDLAQTAAGLGAPVTAQAIRKRRTPALRDALRELLGEALQRKVTGASRATGLLARFPAVWVGDASTIPLTAALASQYPGTGGDAGPAALKLQTLWDLRSGQLQIRLEAGKQSDTKSPLAEQSFPAGSLVLRDLGYFKLARFRRWDAAGIRWISRALHDLTVTDDDGNPAGPLIRWLVRQKADALDRTVTVGTGDQRLTCRLVATRLPKPQAAKRRAKQRRTARKKGRTPSADRLAACDWTILLTNLPADEFPADQVATLYRVRWQVELLFKLWKSHGHLERHLSDDPVQQMLVLSARLLACLLQHWTLVTLAWPVPNLSLTKAAAALRPHVTLIVAAFAGAARLKHVLHRLTPLLRRCRIDRRRNQPGTVQTLQNTGKNA